VLADLCQGFGLSASSTQLWQANNELRPEQELQEVRSNVWLLYAVLGVSQDSCPTDFGYCCTLLHILQAHLRAGSKDSVHLHLVFTPTISFYLWYTFKIGITSKRKALASSWMHSAKACAALYRAGLPQLLHVHHAQQLPVSALQFSGYPDSQKLSAEDLSGLDSGSLIVMSALKRLKLDLCSLACLTTDAQAAVAQWKHTVQPQRTNQAVGKPDKYMAALRATVLVFKLATLASGVKGATSVSRTMWHTLSLLSERLEGSHGGSSLPTPSTIKSPPGLQVESDEKLYLSWQLIERIVPVITQQVQSDSSQAVCCGLLLRLLKTAAPSVQLGMVLNIIDSGRPL